MNTANASAWSTAAAAPCRAGSPRRSSTPTSAGNTTRSSPTPRPFRLDGGGLLTTDTYVVDPPFFPGRRHRPPGGVRHVQRPGRVRRHAAGPVAGPGAGGGLSSGGPAPGAALRCGPRPTRPGSGSSPGTPRWCPPARAEGSTSTPRGWAGPRPGLSLSPARMRAGDRVLVSAPVGAHGLAVLAARESLPVGAGLLSDCANLHPLCAASERPGRRPALHARRDPRRAWPPS